MISGPIKGIKNLNPVLQQLNNKMLKIGWPKLTLLNV